MVRMRRHRKRQMLAMRNSSPYVTLGVARYYSIGFSRTLVLGSYAQLGTMRKRGLTIRPAFGPNFKRPANISSSSK